MSQPTQRGPAQEGTAAVPTVDSAISASPADPLPLTLVSDRVPVRAPLAAPVTFPGYEILGELGRGGMGVVYKARQRNLNRLVALKVILGGPLASEEDKARFRVEAEAAARLHHPNIVQVYDVGEYAGFSYMALELVEGETLRQWQSGQPIEPKVAAKLVSAIARAIQHAHEQGIVHRDIKPANVLLAPVTAAQPELGAPNAALPTLVAATTASRHSSGSHVAPLSMIPKVTDFGLAKALENGQDLTMTGVACGTPNYMAPEQVRGKALSPTVDVYGLGSVLYELLAGRPPFVGTDAAEVMNHILKTEPPNVRKFAPNVPRDLAVIVAKCLEKTASARYATARDLADDLDRFLANKPIAARPISSTERAWRWVKRNPVVTAFLLISTVGCGITGGLAVALARYAEDERQARGSAETAREEAEKQRLAAEQARDGLRTALAATEAARQQADREKKAADAAKNVADTEKHAADVAREEAKQEAKRAGEKQKEADAARARAEGNLRVARGVIRVSIRELSRHPRFEEEDFRAARGPIMEQSRSFRDTVAKQAPNTPEWLDDLADVSHWLGYLEFLNNNQNGAATEYKRAAEAAGKWAALEPKKPEPRARQSFSLVNAGNALVNARQLADAETCYRAAVALIDGVVSEFPKNAEYRRQGIDAYGALANVLRVREKFDEAAEVCKTEAARAAELIQMCGKAPEHLAHLGTAHTNAAKALALLKKWDEAGEQYTAAVTAWEDAYTAAPNNAKFITEYASAVYARAAHLAARGKADDADEAFRAVVARLEKARTAAPGAYAPSLAVAAICTQYAEFNRAYRQLDEAERRYDQALAITAVLTKAAPTFKPGREVWAQAATGRAHLYNQTRRHREAAAEWAKLATDDPDPRAKSRHELFVLQSLLFANDWKAATAGADAHMKRELPGWLWIDLARVWCLAAKQIDADDTLTPADKLRQADSAIGKAVTCLEKARAVGEFQNAERVRWFNSNPDYAAVRGKFDPNKK